MRSNLFLACLSCASLIQISASVCFANPKTDPDGLGLAEFIPIAFLLLLMEGVIIALLARKSLAHRIRFVGIWLIITLCTWAGLILGIDSIRGSLNDIAALVIGEVFVVIVEAFAILLLLGWKTFACGTNDPPSFARCLV